MAERKVQVVGGDDDEQIVLLDERVGATCRLTCLVRGETVVVDESDFFRALQTIRRRGLQPKGLIPFCYGASLNVWPSGMARDMGLGLKAYRMEMGRPATELVDIFAEGSDVIPSLVAEQDAFARDWFASLGSRPTAPTP